MMIGAALMYALHVVLSQRAMYEMPAPTMSIYALTAMAVTSTNGMRRRLGRLFGLRPSRALGKTQ